MYLERTRQKKIHKRYGTLKNDLGKLCNILINNVLQNNQYIVLTIKKMCEKKMFVEEMISNPNYALEFRKCS